jgi:carbon-monoxide dehydrogenase medium subunit
MILGSEILREHANCLQQACAGIGGSQVRNVATIGGNVAHALPAGDGSIALLALNAQAKIISDAGERWENLEDLFQGPGRAFRFPISKFGDRSGFHRVMRPQGVAIAILNMAIWLHQKDSGKISDVRIAVGPAGPVPARARQTEEFLRDREVDESVITQATDILQKELKLRTSKHRATKEYRKHLLGYLLRTLIGNKSETRD